uniref:Ankyrin repeat protein n=1 Tax=Mimivirus LCMiAC01 TaxID=2506608 RepID=A0A481YZR5_9VIRU|nr:MAG: ankyrin repeat protein [Mimivirus LCMiAC01]
MSSNDANIPNEENGPTGDTSNESPLNEESGPTGDTSSEMGPTGDTSNEESGPTGDTSNEQNIQSALDFIYEESYSRGNQLNRSAIRSAIDALVSDPNLLRDESGVLRRDRMLEVLDELASNPANIDRIYGNEFLSDDDMQAMVLAEAEDMQAMVLAEAEDEDEAEYEDEYEDVENEINVDSDVDSLPELEEYGSNISQNYQEVPYVMKRRLKTRFIKQLSSIEIEYNTVQLMYEQTPIMSDYIKQINNMKKESIVELLDYTYNINEVDVRGLRYDTWILKTDFGNRMDEDRVKMAKLMSLYNPMMNIIDITTINPVCYDDSFRKYIIMSQEIVAYVVNKMMDNYNWKFDPMNKFTWIYLAIACRYEPRAIKYLINSSDFVKSDLDILDRIGMTCKYLVCTSNNIDVIKLFLEKKYITGVDFTKDNEFVPPIIHNIRDINVFKYIVENIDGVKEQIRHHYSNGRNIFLAACQYNQEVAIYMLESDLIDKSEFSYTYENITCLILAAIYNPNLMKILLEHDFCTQELVDTVHPNCGNVFMAAIKYHKNMLEYVLNSKYMNDKLLSSVIRHIDNYSSNILFEYASSLSDMKVILSSPYFTQKIMLHRTADINILVEFANINVDAIDLLLKSEHFVPELLTMKCGDLPCISLLCKMESIAYKHIIKSAHFTKDLLLCLDNDGNNCLTNILRRPDMDEEIVHYIVDNHVTFELLAQKGKNMINTFTYLMKYCPSDAKKLMDTDHFRIELLTDKSINNGTMLECMCIIGDDINLLTELIKHSSTKLLEHTNDMGNNIVLTLAKRRPEYVPLIINSKHCTKNVFCAINNKNDNLLFVLIKNTNVKYIIEAVISHEFCTKEMINATDKMNENIFSLACQKNNKIANYILHLQNLNIDMFRNVNTNGVNCFMKACAYGDIELVKLIGEHPLFTQEIYASKDNTGKTYLSYFRKASIEVFRYAINHKYNSREFMTDSIKSCLRTSAIILYTENRIKELIASPYCSTETLMVPLKFSQDNMNMLSYCVRCNYSDAIVDIMQSEHMTSKVLEQVDNKNNTCLQQITKIDDNVLIDNIICSPYFTLEILKNMDAKGNTYIRKLMFTNKIEELKKILSLNICDETVLTQTTQLTHTDMCIYSALANFVDHKLIEHVLNLPYSTAEGLMTTDSNNETVLHRLAELDDYCDELDLILKSYKCTPELLEKTNVNGDTFIMKNIKYLDKVLESEHCTTKLLINIDRLKSNLLCNLCKESPDKIPMLLAHPKITEDIFMMDVENNLLLPCIEENSLKHILKSKICTDKIINNSYKIVKGHLSNVDIELTLLYYYVIANRHDCIKILLESEYDLTPSFNQNINGKNMLTSVASIEKNDAFKILFDSKYVNMEMLMQIDQYEHNFLTRAFSTNIDVMKCLLESKYWSEETMYHKDIDDDFLLVYCRDEPDMVEYALNSPKCTKKFVALTNKYGRNCSHYFAKHNKDSIKLLLKSKHCDSDIIEQQDVLGKTCLHVSCEQNSDAAIELLESSYFTPSLLGKQDNMGRNALMVALINDKDLAIKLLKSHKYTQDIMMQIDAEHNNILHYAARYSDKVLKYILDSEYYDKGMIMHRNNNYETCVMYACRYNGESVKHIIELDDFSEDQLYCGHSDFGSGLTTAARYQPIAIKYILAYPKLSWEIRISSVDNMNFIMIGCMYNAESVKHAMDADINLEDQLTNYSKEGPPLLLAAKYQPDALKYIMESKYCNDKLIRATKSGVGCIEIAFNFQPKSLRYIIESKHATDAFIEKEDSHGHKLSYKLSCIYPNIHSLKDIKEKLKDISLTNHDNKLALEDSDSYEDSDSCDICCTYKKRVYSNSCGHTMCVGCAFHIKKCPQCRKLIKKIRFIF